MDVQVNTKLFAGPVTALIVIGQTVIAGIGENLNIYDLHLQKQIAVLKTLPCCNIHGIIKDGEQSLLDCLTKPSDCLLCIFGKKCVQIITYNKENHRMLFKTKMSTFEDWIWDASWLKQDTDSPFIALALGHNVVLRWKWRENVVIDRVSCEEQCILYSAHFIGNKWEELVLAAGTVYNQIVIWAPAGPGKGKDRKVLHQLSGHQGVIFSIDYNTKQQQICSASDDRSIRVWQLQFPFSADHLTVDSWANIDSKLLKVLYGHVARVWRAHLLSNGVVSIGEDATCCVWNSEGKIVKKFKGHKGKSIWSMAISEDEKFIVTGGGDNSIRLWYFSDHLQQQEMKIKTLQLPDDAQVAEGDKDFPRIVTLKDFNTILVMSNNGILYKFCLVHTKWDTVMTDASFSSYCSLAVSSYDCSIAVGNILGYIRVFYDKVSGNCQCGTTYLSCDLMAYKGRVFSLQWISMKNLLSTGPDGLLHKWKLQITDLTAVLKLDVSLFLPHCKHRWVSAAATVPKEDILVCGDRGGTVHVYNLATAEHSNKRMHHPVQSFPKVHGKVAVTDVCYHDECVYTAGQDGHFRQYSIREGSLELLNSNKVFKGLEWIGKLEFYEEDLLICGFHSSNFILCSTSKCQNLLSIPCGGGHRTWSCMLEEGYMRFVYIKTQHIVICQASVVSNQIILQPSLHGRQTTGIRYLQAVMETPDQRMHLCATSSEDTTIQILGFSSNPTTLKVLKTIQGHLSSIRALVSVESLVAGTGVNKKILLFSAGGRAEIIVWRLTFNTIPIISCIHEQLTKHSLVRVTSKPKLKPWRTNVFNLHPETRILHMDAFRACDLDSDALSSVNFVAAACSDTFVRLFGFNETKRRLEVIWESDFHDSCVLNVTYFIHCLNDEKFVFLLSAATDGQILFWNVSKVCESFMSAESIQNRHETHAVNDPGEGETTLFPKGDCDHSAQHSKRNEIVIPGENAELYNSYLSPDTQRKVTKSGSCPTEKQMENYAGNLHEVPHLCGGHNSEDHQSISGIQDHPSFVITAHQSGINCLNVQKRSDSKYSLVSGGDDNALHVVIFQVEPNRAGQLGVKELILGTKVDAHAAQITGAKFIGEDYLVSSSIDQRVCIWKLIYKDHIQIELLHTKFVTVPDIASMTVWNNASQYYAAMCGSGIGILQISELSEETETS